MVIDDNDLKDMQRRLVIKMCNLYRTKSTKALFLIATIPAQEQL